ncbi:hypothetical protein LCGC14_1350540 [marine sediment metagenome]|uniref:Uncharacterized protein n=1 Tax=marine sediment metagenome TaxID=412755 RepID=A0A0F9KBR1_9ZZZZ|nr:hypothetical protein [Candidatus Scalindua sp.]
MSNKKNVRNKQYTINPWCVRCGVLMILFKDLPRNRNGNIAKILPDNMCTYEHRFTRYEMVDRLANKIENGIVCNKCNNELNRIEELKMPIEELHRRSGQENKS